MPSELKSVRLVETELRVIPPELLDRVVCVQCRNHPARWELGEWMQVCSGCLLYKAPELAAQADEIRQFIGRVEVAIGVVFERTPAGELSNPHDADRIAFGIVAAHRVELARKGRV